MKSKEYWDNTFEARFEKQKKDANRPPLKVKNTCMCKRISRQRPNFHFYSMVSSLGNHSPSFSQRSWMVENIRKLFPLRVQADNQPHGFQIAAI